MTDQTVRIPGTMATNKPFCSFTEPERKAFTLSALETIKEFACPITNTCRVEIITVCGENEGSRQDVSTSSLSRKLQSQTWQVEYLITEVFTCESSTCTSPSDESKVSTIINSITSSINDAMGNGLFREVFSVNILESPDLDDGLVSCLMIWGTVRAAETEIDASGEGSSQTGVFYPDWTSHSGTCLQDGNEPAYMKSSGVWTFDSLEDCCSRFYPGWNYNKCVNPYGSGLWFVDHMSGKCVTDCEKGSGETCGGYANLASDNLYFDPKDCCKKELFYRFVEFCEVRKFIHLYNLLIIIYLSNFSPYLYFVG